MAQSPPAWQPNSPLHHRSSLMNQGVEDRLQPLTARNGSLKPHTDINANMSNLNLKGEIDGAPGAGAAQEEEHPPPRVSTVRILPTSIPWVHNQLMERMRRDKEAGLSSESPAKGDESEMGEGLSQERSQADQEETARRLKPHSRSSIHLQELNARHAAEPDGNKPAQPKKQKQTKWQFGIRSRNQPHEAMLSLYKMLRREGAQWSYDWPEEEDEEKRKSGEGLKYNAAALNRIVTNPPRKKYDDGFGNQAVSEGDLELPSGAEDSPIPKGMRYYIPADLWCIHARILKTGMFPPGQGPPGSTNSSSVNLPAHTVYHTEAGYRLTHDLSGSRASSASASSTNLATDPSSPSHTGPGSSAPAGLQGSSGSMTTESKHNSNVGSIGSAPLESNEGVWVYITIQLYTVDAGNFLVDFKCDGYENVKRGEDGKWKSTSRRTREKEVTSAFPFLDVASDLIVKLAQAGS